ncbi:LysR family transcriptional regulator [Prosthecobacter vanneervenii]|uniref:LysR family transcriptional activator of nhaA n=1 Tax=Prosthecobacter vanneervenii TaxID=48466 RepID=A0A7W7YFY9_9BACT|nr:LysR family transcriptional regulator [Prosthecobacter vanneervenii]MBB5035443.1 LysR family transcriptional activator of nhaA [Prosthecobacter vanneervenii]
MAFLNYHHLRYFRAIAMEGSLTKAAKQLKLSQSALSVQLRSLETSLGQALFERKHKTLMLTEAGRIALEYAHAIFRSGEELSDVLKNHAGRGRGLLRVGAASNLSRNFQLSFLRPLIPRDDVELIIHSGTLRELLAQLQNHKLDVVLSNTPVRRDAETGFHSHLLDEQSVSLVGHKKRGMRPFRFPEDLRKTPIVLPSLESSIRTAFDILMDQSGIRPIIAAEVDDMAMLRLMARETHGVTLVPPVVVKDELETGTLVERHRFPQIKETFYAITPSRRFPNLILRELMREKKK